MGGLVAPGDTGNRTVQSLITCVDLAPDHGGKCLRVEGEVEDLG